MFDHEEVGSKSAQGAGSNVLAELLQRIMLCAYPDATEEQVSTAKSNSLMLSMDTGLANHPNYPQYYEQTHLTNINSGPSVAFSPMQNFITDSVGFSLMKQIAKEANVEI